MNESNMSVLKESLYNIMDKSDTADIDSPLNRSVYTRDEATSMSKEERLNAVMNFNDMSSPFIIGVISIESGNVSIVDLYTLEGIRVALPFKDKEPNRIKIKQSIDVPNDGLMARIRITVADNETGAFKKNPFYLWQEYNSKIELLNEIPRKFVLENNDNILISSTIYNAAKLAIDSDVKQEQDNADKIKLQIEEELAAQRSVLVELNELHASLQLDFSQLQDDINDLNLKKRLLDSECQRIAGVAEVKFLMLRSLDLISEEHFTQLTDRKVSSSEVEGETISWQDDVKCNWHLTVSIIHSYLLEKEKVVYPRWLIANFLTLLRTNDLIILSGLSGSGKTQLVRSMANAMCGVSHIIPVKPNWTGPEDLLGFFNPLQRTYVKTPFLEALLAASKDPDHLHLICLDEMNLARAEYYFADFLSELENRQKPSIKLYSKSEKEHILAELKLLFRNSEGELSAELRRDEYSVSVLEKLLNSNSDENLPVLHDRLRRALSTVLDVPPELPIPVNVRFIGCINVDQTTFGLSPKILDRCHVVRFENPLNYDATEISTLAASTLDQEALPRLAPVKITPEEFAPVRTDYPSYDSSHPAAKWLHKIYFDYLKYLGIDVAFRSIRQAQAYWELVTEVFPTENGVDIAKSLIVQQKVLPKFTIDGKVKTKLQGKDKERWEIVREMEQDIKEDAEKCGFEPNMYSELNRVRMSAESIERIFNYWA